MKNIVTFDQLNLNTPLLNALIDLEYIYPTPIQTKAFPVIMAGKNIVGIAQTGTGKTFAYLLPLLRLLPFADQKDPRILIVVPTRELVIQVTNEIKKLTVYMNIRVEGIYGGTNINTQKQAVYNGVDILVATPGRFIDIAMHGILRLKSIQKLVIDEVDEMLNLGFRPQLMSIMEMLPDKRQNLMFSATLSPDVNKIINDYFDVYQKIEIAPHGTSLDKINQTAYLVPNFHTKVNLLENLFFQNKGMTKVLVFVNTKKLADKLFDAIASKFPESIGVLHSNKSQNYRINTIKSFEDGTYKMLISTDIIARGLDICNVTHVINFETPEIAGDYIHRIGRTGRANKNGEAITFINEAEVKYQKEIELLIKQPIPIQPLPDDIFVSNVLTDEEKPSKQFDKNYFKQSSLKKESGAAFHEKKEKNKKINLGSPSKNNMKRVNFEKEKLKKTKKPPKIRF